MKKFLLLIFFSFSSFISFSQYIEGKVLDATTNKPIKGVNVYMEGINRGAITNAKGNYYLKFPAKIVKSDVIQFSHIAYKTKKIPFTSNKNNYVVYLFIDLKKLKEVKISEKRNLKKSISYKKLSSMKIAVHSFGSILINDKIYVDGGDASIGENMFLKTLEYYPDIADFGEFLAKANRFHSFSNSRYYGDLQVYDIKNNVWTKSPSKFKKRAYHNLNYYNHKIYVLGGKNLARHGRYFNEYLEDKIEVFDIIKNTIIIDNTNPHQTANFASFTYKDNIIIAGGSIKKKKNGFKEFSNKVHLYNIKTGLWYVLATMPIAKEVNGVLIDNTIYLIGGFNNIPLGSIETFNIKTGKWKKEGNLFYGIGKPAITHNGNIIYIFNNGKINTYNVLTKELNEYLIDLPLEESELYYFDNKLYILGGFRKNSYSITPSKDLFSIDISEFNKTKIQNLKTL